MDRNLVKCGVCSGAGEHYESDSVMSAFVPCRQCSGRGRVKIMREHSDTWHDVAADMLRLKEVDRAVRLISEEESGYVFVPREEYERLVGIDKRNRSGTGLRGSSSLGSGYVHAPYAPDSFTGPGTQTWAALLDSLGKEVAYDGYARAPYDPTSAAPLEFATYPVDRATSVIVNAVAFMDAPTGGRAMMQVTLQRPVLLNMGVASMLRIDLPMD